MLKSIILCYSNDFEEQYFKSIALHYSKLFTFQFINSSYFSKEIKTDGIFSFEQPHNDIPTLLFSQEKELDNFYAIPKELWDNNYIFSLNELLFDFHHKLAELDLLTLFPNDLVIEDTDGNTHINHLSHSIFTNDSKIESWVLSEPSFLENGYIHFLEPSDSFEQIMMDSYYLLKDNNAMIKGYAYQKQDIKPILKSYLDETAQALVGWSNVVSGASIKNEDF